MKQQQQQYTEHNIFANNLMVYNYGNNLGVSLLYTDILFLYNHTKDQGKDIFIYNFLNIFSFFEIKWQKRKQYTFSVVSTHTHTQWLSNKTPSN